MGVLAPLLLLLALSPYTISRDHAPLRSGCAEDATPLASLPAGSPVEIRFAVAGMSPACYKVSAVLDGKPVLGYVAADAIANLDQFQRARNEASASELPHEVRWTLEETRQALPAATRDDGTHPLTRSIRLLEANRPAEALRILEAQLQSGPRDHQTLALAGLAARRADDLQRSAHYLKESLDLHHTGGVESLYRSVVRELSADRSGERLYGNRFLLRYDNTAVPPDTAHSMVSLLESEFTRIAAQLGCRTEERIAVIVQTEDAYRKGHDAAEWSAGFYDGKIHIPVLDGPQISPATRRTFSHELVHACLANLGNYPAWLHEGLAQSLSGDSLSPAGRNEIRALLRAQRLPRLERLRQDWSRMSPNHARLAYRYALFATETMVDAYRDYGLQNVLRNPEGLPQVMAHLDARLAQ